MCVQGDPGTDGADGQPGEPGESGLPGRKVRECLYVCTHIHTYTRRLAAHVTHVANTCGHTS